MHVANDLSVARDFHRTPIGIYISSGDADVGFRWAILLYRYKIRFG